MAFVATFAAPPRDLFPSVQSRKWTRRIDARSTADGRRRCAGGLVRMAREDDVSGSITNPVDPAAVGPCGQASPIGIQASLLSCPPPWGRPVGFWELGGRHGE